MTIFKSESGGNAVRVVPAVDNRSVRITATPSFGCALNHDEMFRLYEWLGKLLGVSK